MKITGCHIYRYELPLIKPIVVKGVHIHTRKGLLLELQAEDGCFGFGDIAPLEGFSKETLAQAEEQIINLRHFLLNSSIPAEIEQLNGKFKEWLGELNLHSTVQFGVESAVLHLKAAKQNVSLAELLSETTHKSIPINGLLIGDEQSVVEQAKAHILDGYIGLKLKVGRDVDADIIKVKAVSKIVREKALLHLDANQQWSVEDAIRFGEEVGPAAVDYIEEPFKELERMHEFYDKTLIPIALDESLTELPFDKVKSLDPVDILVLKPSLLGGIERVWQMIQSAKSFGIETLISSIYESSIGIYTLMNIAGCSFRNNAAGLDTIKYFKADVLKKPLDFKKGRLILNNRIMDYEALNTEYVERIST